MPEQDIEFVAGIKIYNSKKNEYNRTHSFYVTLNLDDCFTTINCSVQKLSTKITRNQPIFIRET